MTAATEPAGRWSALAVLATVVLLALVPWFSAASVAPLIANDWGIGSFEVALLTVAVQVGFAIGALVVAVTGAADVVPARYLIASERAFAGSMPTMGSRSGPTHGHAVPRGHQAGLPRR